MNLPHRVVVVALPGVYPYELGVVSRFFGAASSGGQPAYDVRTCSLDGAPVRTTADFDVIVTGGVDLLESADTIIVPPWDGATESGDPIGLQRFSSARLVSFCTGAFTVAAAGLLDNISATTHWCVMDEFRSRFPRVHLRADELFVDAGRILTAAGASAAIDLSLYLIGRDCGSAVAADVARTTLAPPHRDGGQAQFIARPVVDSDIPGRSGEVQEWCLRHVEEPLELKDIAREFNVSVRTLTRRFRAETGATLGDWLINARLVRAREILETSTASMPEVAARSGFATAAAMRKHFRERLGVAPQSYRERFRQSA